MFVPCAAVLFDCDGVLVDSDASIIRCWTAWAMHYHLDPELVLATMHGKRSADTVAEYIGEPGRTEAKRLIDQLEIEDTESTIAIPGALELLASIPETRRATVTSGSRLLASARLLAAGLQVPQVMVTSDDITLGKPHPEGYIAGAKRLGVDPRHCIVVEDAPAGIQAGQAAGAGFVLRVGHRELGDIVPDASVPDLRSVRWTDDGVEILIP